MVDARKREVKSINLWLSLFDFDLISFFALLCGFYDKFFCDFKLQFGFIETVNFFIALQLFYKHSLGREIKLDNKIHICTLLFCDRY